MTECRVCGHELTTTYVPGVLVCLHCHTSYNLATKTVDTYNTKVGISDCKHRKKSFICGANWTGNDGHGRYNVSICPDCGQFHIWGDQNGEHYEIRFELPSDDLVQAAGKYAAFLSECP